MRADQIAHEFGYQKLQLPGAQFEHVAYFKPALGANALHVYIEHDGTPWSNPTTPAADPTPENPLMLAMMSLDTAPALYLGRPCHFGTAAQPPCEPIWWTHRRFSPEVVHSMASALRHFLSMHRNFEALHFFGYSGGGVVATLMAAQFSATRRLVTVCAPLDVDGWIRLHRFTPMAGSINPVDQPPLAASVNQLHLAGAEDHVVPGHLIKPFVKKQAGAKYLEIAGFNHYCCWAESWRRLVLQP